MFNISLVIHDDCTCSESCLSLRGSRTPLMTNLCRSSHDDVVSCSVATASCLAVSPPGSTVGCGDDSGSVESLDHVDSRSTDRSRDVDDPPRRSRSDGTCVISSFVSTSSNVIFSS